MDTGNQGRSCGVEAAYNAGFYQINASSFYRQSDLTVDPQEFVGVVNSNLDAHDDYIDNTGGGNDIPERGPKIAQTPRPRSKAVWTPRACNRRGNIKS